MAVELLLVAAAAGTMALLVMAGGALLDSSATATQTISPAPIARTVELRPADLEVDDSDAVVVTRRKAAAREIERQWQAQEAATASPTTLEPSLPPTSPHESP